MFNELKNLFGLLNAWQQTRQTLARWSTMICLAYGLRPVSCLSSWNRKE